jgi:hypothetical protein
VSALRLATSHPSHGMAFFKLYCMSDFDMNKTGNSKLTTAGIRFLRCVTRRTKRETMRNENRIIEKHYGRQIKK